MNKEWALHDRLLKLESEAASYSSVKAAKNISSGLLAPEQKLVFQSKIRDLPCVSCATLAQSLNKN